MQLFFHNFAHFAYLHIFELHTIFVFFTTLHNVAYFAPVSICSTSTSSIVWSLFLKLFKPLALCQQLMFYISTGTTSWKAGLSFSVNIFRFCLYPIHPHSIFTLTRRWKVHICQSWRKQESLMRTYLSPVIIKLMKFGMLNCRGALIISRTTERRKGEGASEHWIREKWATFLKVAHSGTTHASPNFSLHNFGSLFVLAEDYCFYIPPFLCPSTFSSKILVCLKHRRVQNISVSINIVLQNSAVPKLLLCTKYCCAQIIVVSKILLCPNYCCV